MNWTFRNSLIFVYVVGNALTYRHLVKVDPSHAFVAATLAKNLALSFVWPLYWLISAI
jgi:hypothetical protein